jgi:hypothetical protein
MTVKEIKKRAIIKINLSDWEWGNWPRMIINAFSIEKRFGSLEITLDLDDETVIPIVKQIVTEGIEEFLNIYDMTVKMTTKGIELHSEIADHPFVIPWIEVCPDNLPAVEKAREMLLEMEKEFSDEEDDE